MTFDFHPDAHAEYLEAASFYESRRAGLGAAFSFAVEGAIQRIIDAPERWREIEQDIRTCRTHTFPYAILYTIEPNSILILAVMHLHREPGYWRDRDSRT
jgi:plasmid stabilization system protein ParE